MFQSNVPQRSLYGWMCLRELVLANGKTYQLQPIGMFGLGKNKSKKEKEKNKEKMEIYSIQ